MCIPYLVVTVTRYQVPYAQIDMAEEGTGIIYYGVLLVESLVVVGSTLCTTTVVSVLPGSKYYRSSVAQGGTVVK